MASPNALKRTYAEAGLDHPTYDQSSPAHFQSLATTPTVESSKSCTSSQNPLAPEHSNTAPEGFNPTGAILPPENAPTSTSEPAVKKAKLTFAEKEVKRIEKEFKDRQKAEEKAKREEEKAKKEEERVRREAEKEAEKARREKDKRAKDAEREEKRRVKEEQARTRQEEKRQKEDERQKKEEEKNKKAKSQLRLNAFFVQPSLSNRAPSGSPARDGPSPLSSRRSSISESNAMEAEARHRSCSISSTPRKPRLPDYERSFPSFFVQSHTTLAPNHRFCRDEKGLCYVQEKIDEALLQSQKASDMSKEIAFHPHNLLQISPHRSYRCPPSVMSVKDIVAEIDGVSHNPIDLTESQFQRATKRPLDLLKSIPFKILKFAEDVRPPYIGTYTRLQDPRTISRLARNPFRRELPETNYDYDSEAEWEEPGEGEDLDSEGEEEIEDEDEADMEGFLDDEETDARTVKRRPILGDLEPTCSGLCWEGPQAQGSETPAIDLLMFKLDILMEQPQLPIDPYSSSYWQPKSSLQTPSRVQGSLMEPPRIPLNPVNRQNTILPVSAAWKDRPSDPSATTKPTKPPPRLLPPELMEDFKKAVQGNDLTKLGLLEVLKKQFPKQPKDSIRHTLEHVAERVGSKVQDKKWVLKSGLQCLSGCMNL